MRDSPPSDYPLESVREPLAEKEIVVVLLKGSEVDVAHGANGAVHGGQQGRAIGVHAGAVNSAASRVAHARDIGLRVEQERMDVWAARIAHGEQRGCAENRGQECVTECIEFEAHIRS